ncbi:MAG: hypothetical protein Q8L37_01850 [Candidatus Gottesmanbacteria bacterium]|nr:hypothetical protein [Candidatus Gottesmanbacteria bacterium]
MKKESKPIFYGALASVGLLSLYAVTMTLLSGWGAAVEQFSALWYLMVPLAAGFGIQVGLYTKLKATIRERSKGAIAAGGTSAGASMLACCVHHATDVLPLLGLSGLSLFLTQFQKPILIISLGINVLGIYVIFKHIKHETVSKTTLILMTIASVTLLAVWGIASQRTLNEKTSLSPATLAWETKEHVGGNVTVAVTPITLRPLFPASFDVAFETHSVELDFVIESVVRLTDEKGTRYTPHWQGSPPGGHHRKGTLVFTPDIPKLTILTLEFIKIAGIPSRTFKWEVNKP